MKTETTTRTQARTRTPCRLTDRMDVYSWALCVHEMMARTRPHQGLALGAVVVQVFVLHARPPRPDMADRWGPVRTRGWVGAVCCRGGGGTQGEW